MSSADADVERGTVPRESYNVAVGQATLLGRDVRAMQKHEKSASRTLDILRRVTQVGVLVVLVLLGIVYYLSPHPALNTPHKNPFFAALAAICMGYAVALQVARGKFSVVLLLIMSGFGAFMFSLGYVLAELKRFV
jgi:hypothetical protein